MRENSAHHSFHYNRHVLFVYEGHFYVYLRVFRLSVGTQFFVAEVPGELEIAVHARHHQHLLELLRRLRKGVEFTRVCPRRHHEVARAFRSGAGKQRSLYLVELQIVKVVSYNLRKTAAQHQVFCHLFSAQVEKTVFKPRFFRYPGVFLKVERKRKRSAQNRYFFGDHFYFTGGHIPVRVRARPRPYGAGYVKNVFAFDAFGGAEYGTVGVHYYLRYAVQIPQVYEEYSAVVSFSVYPAGESDFFPVV